VSCSCSCSCVFFGYDYFNGQILVLISELQKKTLNSLIAILLGDVSTSNSYLFPEKINE
jgi:hypothetical protein